MTAGRGCLSESHQQKASQGPPMSQRSGAVERCWTRRGEDGGPCLQASQASQIHPLAWGGGPRGLKDLSKRCHQQPQQTWLCRPLECPHHLGGQFLGDLQATGTEVMAVPTLPILHRLPKNCGWLGEAAKIASKNFSSSPTRFRERPRRPVRGRPWSCTLYLKTLASRVQRA